MTDREFRKLRRSDLVEIIYQLQKDLESLKTENENLRAEIIKTADIKGKGSEKDGTGAP